MFAAFLRISILTVFPIHQNLCTQLLVLFTLGNIKVILEFFSTVKKFISLVNCGRLFCNIV